MPEAVKDDSGNRQSDRERTTVQYPWTVGEDESISEHAVFSWSVLPMVYASDASPHPWLIGAVRELRSLLMLKSGWDGYEGSPISGRAIERASEVLQVIAKSEAPPPAIVPTSSGGIQIEWYRSNIELQIEIEPSNERLQIAYRNLETGAWWRGPFGDEPDPLEKVLWRLSREG